MANSFNASEFFKGAYYSPIQVGKHTVKLGKVKMVISTNETTNEDASYLLVSMHFNNNRTIDQRFYGYGARIFCDQIRNQLNDETDYPKLSAFLKTLEDKEVDVWISKRTFVSRDGKQKSALQFDFVEPTPDDPNDEEPFTAE